MTFLWWFGLISSLYILSNYLFLFLSLYHHLKTHWLNWGKVFPSLAFKVPLGGIDLEPGNEMSKVKDLAKRSQSWFIHTTERCVLTVLILELMQLYSKRLKACSEGCRKLRKGSSPTVLIDKYKNLGQWLKHWRSALNAYWMNEQTHS